MLFRLRCLVLLLLFGHLAAAQTYEPGLLVRSNGDTLRGEIENNFWVEPPEFIHFRRTAADVPELLQPRQLRAVSFTGGRYFSYQVLALDHAATTQLSDLPRGNVPRIEIDSVLAEVLLAGPVSLLRVELPGSTHYVLQRPGQLPVELAGRRYLRESPDGGWRVTEGNNYRDQLRLYFRDCPAAATAAAKAPYTVAGLVAVAQAYATTCTEARQPASSWLELARPRRRGALQAGVLGGVRYHRIESTYYAYAGTCTDCRPHPFGGLYAELLQPSRTAAFYGELSLSTFRNRGADSFRDQFGEYTYKPFEYAGLLATARLGVRRLWPLPHNQQLLLGLGFEYNHALALSLPPPAAGANSRWPTDDDRQPYATPTILPNLGLGWRRQRLTLMLDGQLYTDTNSDGLLQIFLGHNFAARLGVSYRLGRNPDEPRTAATH